MHGSLCNILRIYIIGSGVSKHAWKARGIACVHFHSACKNPTRYHARIWKVLQLLLHPRRFSITGADLCRHSISFCIHNPSQKQEESRAFLLRKPATGARRRGCSSWGCDGEPSVISLSPPLVSPLLSYECHIHFPFSGAWTEPPGMMVRTITCEPLIHLHV